MSPKREPDPRGARRAADGPAADTSALAAGIGRLLDDPALGARLGKNARATFRERLTVDHMVRGMIDLYRSVAAM